jgi:cytochrome c biogenesis protein CcdA
MDIIQIVGNLMIKEEMMRLFNVLQNDVEPLPEPWRSVFFYSTVLAVLVIPLLACVISNIQKRSTKKRVEELGSSWDEVDSQIPKTEDEMIEALPCFAFIILIVFVGIVVVLTILIGPIVQDIAVVILMGGAIVFIIALCPILMIWGVKIEAKRNRKRIKLAEESRHLRETGQDIDSQE